MTLDAIKAVPKRALCYLERYVNDGSPSGFSRPGQLGVGTDPFGTSPWYHPHVLIPEPGRLETFGEIPELPDCPKNSFFLHPDVCTHADLAAHSVNKLKSIKLVPTSSGRTGRIVEPVCDYYLKFHYPSIIGRFVRALPREKAIPGPEMSQHLQKAIFQGLLTPRLHVLPETGALVFHAKLGAPASTWGLIFRNTKPFGPQSKDIHSIVPLFSLWSIDRLKSFDLTIVEQLFILHGKKIANAFLECVLLPLIDAYFGLITILGFQMELNAQNILIGFDEHFFPIAIIFRDLNGIEKDLPIHKFLGLPTQYQSNYKVITNEENPELYVIRHSFAFDSKLTHYVLLPIASAVASAAGEHRDFFREELRARVRKWMAKLPIDYFPQDNIWYAHEDIDLSNERPYVKQHGPPLR